MRNYRLFVIVAILLPISTAGAQTITGSVTGTVIDSSGAVVANAKITAVNTGTNLNYTAQTNNTGIYNLRFLPAGSYTLAAEIAGFKKAVVPVFQLDVDQTARVDLTLEVGEITQSVEITAVAPILQTESAQTGDVITAAKAESLPLNGRNFVSLTLLVPGSITPNPASVSSATRFGAGGRPYVNGNREQTNSYLVDGVNVNESLADRVGYSPNVDALEEIKVLTGNAPAEFGNASGAVVNMTLKSGTNEFHGSVFEFLRNDKLDANSFFNNRSGAAKRALRQNIYGGTIGGPVLKNKLFFFADFQGTRNRNSGPTTNSVAPADFRTGNLSSITRPIRDPSTSGNCTATDQTACFPGNIIPASRIVNPVAKALFGDPTLYPLPNAQGTGPIGVSGNYVSTSANFVDNDQGDIKLDARPADKDGLSGRFTIARYTDGLNQTALPVFMGNIQDAPTTGGVITWTRTASPAVVNEARVGFTRTKVVTQTTDPAGKLGINGNAKLGIAGGQPIAGISSITLGEGLTTIGAGASDSGNVANHFQYGDNLTWQHGRHLVKFGGQLLRYQENFYYAGNNGLLGLFTYTGDVTGSAFADFLLNQLRTKGRGSQTGYVGQRQSRVAVFAQDDWKVRPNLTLNLGLRWEYTQPLYEVADRQSNLDLVNGRQLFAGKNGNSRALYDPYYKQFMPRVGFAWTPARLHNKLVVRAGYGITSFIEGTGTNLRLPLNPPLFFESDVTFPVTAPGDIRAGFSDVVARTDFAGQVRAWNPQLRPAFIQQGNFSLERQISPTLTLNVGYVGQKGAHLIDPREYNQPLPGPGSLDPRRPLYSKLPLVTNVSGTDSSSTMSYNSLQVSGRKRFSHGLEFLAAYTLSKTLTDNRGFFGSGSVAIAQEGGYWQNAYDRHSERGRAFFDALHNFSLGGYWDLPFGHGRALGSSFNRAADLLLGGWSASYVVSLRSGFPITILGQDVTNQATRGNTRPNRYGPLTYQNQTIDNWFGTGNTLCLTPGVNDGKCAYGTQANGTFGNSAAATEQAPDLQDVDLGIGKKFVLTEKKYVEFRTEFFNAFNHANFGAPARSIASPTTFGVITTTTTSPRNIEFALKFRF
ncbi:MAG: carboxypeptidase regulatory-like domain-containing protein [Bryobacteraceae bacterium]